MGWNQQFTFSQVQICICNESMVTHSKVKPQSGGKPLQSIQYVLRVDWETRKTGCECLFHTRDTTLFLSDLVKHADIPIFNHSPLLIIPFLKCTVHILKSTMLQKAASFGDVSSFHFHLKYYFSIHEDAKTTFVATSCCYYFLLTPEES